ncbi:uncharacterized protein N7482_000340 [Penicillium canariense]|uniref:V-type ATPase n=1 Tax=Penicillium canariense TaxID=189055 RepID=A0A9W9ID47_9EURO|nr:uncharacterized protein N7482_000340 [Penicillium canariense]KAJ5174463.1 hypothetical protein N7482_000340 [Penicillium canariense]
MSLRLSPKLGSLSVSRSLSRGRRSSGYSSRRYITNSYSAFAYTWLTKTPEAILKSPQDILSSLPSSPTPLLAKDSVPVLLVTPSFAHWLDPSDDFLPNLMCRLYGNDSSSTLYGVAAVIDKIPTNQTPADKPKLEGNESSVVNELESEGLSLLVVDKENVQGKAAPTRRIGGPASEDADLVVSIQGRPVARNSVRATHEIGLRLSNTVFVNGKESTLVGMRWARDAAANAVTLHNTIDLTSCYIAPTSAASDIKPTLTLPLYPVGERRKVIASMGNILRQISKSTDPTSNEPIPASSELEKDLPRYIEEHNIMDQRVSVWALVENPSILIANQDSSTQDRVVQSLHQGGKLHRVMSGGGGWGKKQGLLSLDPEVSFPGTTRRRELVGLDQLFKPKADAELDIPPFLTKSMVGDDLSLLSQVATAGDFIQFFVSVDPAYSLHAVPKDASLADSSITYRFGVVSRAEELSSRDTNDGEKDITVVPNSFGALSEKAIAYAQPVAQGGATSESSTKLDIPGCRVILSPVS